jgi:hypothetical protein
MRGLFLFITLPRTASQATYTVTIDVSDAAFAASCPMNPRLHSCHLDEGYVHASRSLYSNLIVGSAFDRQSVWTASDPSVRFAVDPSKPWQGLPSMGVTIAAGAAAPAPAGLLNKGLGNEGLALVAGQGYEGFAIARAEAPFELLVALVAVGANGSLAVLSSARASHPGGGAWANLSFALPAPAAGTACVGVAPGSVKGLDCGAVWPNADHICVSCAGAVLVGVEGASGAASFDLGYVMVQPDASGRFGGQPVRAEGVGVLRAMGVAGIRVGGTYAQNVMWRDWRGLPELRPTRQFFAGEGNLVGGFGMFEMLDLTAGMGIEGIVTLSRNHTPQDAADLVEYAYGGLGSPWGRVRIVNDSHPAPYLLTGVEWGNEQSNEDWPAQLLAMEARWAALALPQPSPLFYLYPENGLHGGDVAALQAAGFPAEKVMADVHVGVGGGLAGIEASFAATRNYSVAGINCETNGMTHGVGRALGEALDLVAFEGAPCAVYTRVRARMVSFCSERSGHFTRYDQGASFWLPNMTWLQPPGWVHSMAAFSRGAAVLPVALAAAAGAAAPPAGLAASASGTRGAAAHLHLANTLNASARVTLAVAGAGAASALLLRAPPSGDLNASNSPADPLAVAPAPFALETGVEFELPALSFLVVNVSLGNSSKAGRAVVAQLAS